MTEINKYNIDEELLFKFLAGDLNAEDANIIIESIRNDKNEKAKLLNLKNIWQETDNELIEQQFDVEKAIQKFNIHTEKAKLSENVNATHRNRFAINNVFIKIAAVLIIGAFLWFIFPKKAPSFIVLQSNNEILNTVSLPDSSRIDLNKNSKIQYSEKFGKKTREIYLEGEAYFDIENKQNKPFVIYAGNARIEVLGTKFYVKAYGENNKVTVIVDEGEVALSSIDGTIGDTLKDSINIVKKGQVGVFSKLDEEINISELFDENELSWKTGYLVFNSTPFELMREVLEKEFNIRILLTDEEMKNCEITGSFESTTEWAAASFPIIGFIA
jgi:transmembrane sensor